MGINARAKRIASAFGIAAVLGIAANSAPAAPFNRTIAGMYHTRWTVKEGVPNDVVAIQQTKDGYLWLGTGRGLYRFDGVSFERFGPASEDDPLSHRISALLATKDGGLWVGHQGPGNNATFIKDGVIKRVSGSSGGHTGTILAFAQESNGTVWAATDYGLERLSGDRWVDDGPHYPNPSSYPDTVFTDRRGTLWANTRDGLLFRPSGHVEWQKADHTRYENVDLTESPDGSVWMASAMGLVRQVTSPDGKVLSHFPSIEIRSLGLTFAHDGSLWIASTGKGLFRVPAPSQLKLDRATPVSALEHYDERDGLVNNFSDTIFEDREGDVWVTSSKGLDQFRWAKTAPVQLEPGSTYISIAADAHGGLAIGTESLMRAVGGVVVDNRIPPNRIECTYRDPNGNIWLGGVDGLWRLDGSRMLPYRIPAGVEDTGHNVQAIAMDSSGALWVSFDRHGVYRLKGTTWQRSGNLTRFPDSPALVEWMEPQGKLWFGFGGNKIVSVVGSTVSTFDSGQGLDLGNVIAIHGSNGTLWAGGDKGLQFWDGNRFRHLRLNSDASLDGISGIVTDSSGDLWLNGLTGITHIPASELAHALLDPNRSVNFEHLDYLDGLVSAPEQIRPLPSAVRAADGKIYFATRSSVVWLDPAAVFRNRIHPIASVQSVTVNGKPHDVRASLNLPPNVNNLEIRYTAPSLLIPERVRFRYWMEGLDKGWTEASDRRFALYSRIPPGRYRFHVAAANDEGLWSQVDSVTDIVVPPSFLQGIWFKVLCVVSALMVLWLGYRLRFSQINRQISARMYERVAERERISRDLHDTFLQGVQGILLHFRTATLQLGKDQPARARFEEILSQSDSVIAEGRQLLLGLRSNTSEPTDLLNALRDAAASLQSLHSIEVDFHVEGDPRPLSPNIFEESYRIGREALNNAFVHSEAKSIRVTLIYSAKTLMLRVCDDGRGLAPEILRNGAKPGHWGLPGMKERARKIGADFILTSTIELGTTVELRLQSADLYTTSRRFRS